MNEAQIYEGLLKGWFVLSALVFLILQFLSAPYGRHTRGGWGPKVSHLLGWLIMEVPAVGTIIFCYAQTDAKISMPALAFIGLWQLHYVHRTFIFPLRTRAGGKSMPLVIALAGATSNIAIGYLIGRGLTFMGPTRSLDWLHHPMFVGGVCIFLTGFVINLHSDSILINLRDPGETGYKIPKGGLFKYVTCPNYLGEIIEWIGFAIATSSLGALAFAVWTMANLIPRAMQHHAWYVSTFEDYPKNRRRIIPFIL